MAATLTPVPNSSDSWGRLRTKAIDITGDTSYPAGGYPVAARLLGMTKIMACQPTPLNLASTAYLGAYNLATSKFVISYPTGGTGTNPVALTDPGLTVGAITMGGTATGTIPAGATAVTSTAAQPAVSVPAAGLTATLASSPVTPGRGKELPAGANAATLSYRLLFIGSQ